MQGIAFNQDCLSCGLFVALDGVATGYGRQAFETLAPIVRQIFSAFVGLWFAYQLVFKGLYRGELSVQTLLPKLCLFALLQSALAGSGLYWSYIYEPVRLTTSEVAQLVVAPASGAIADPSLTGLLKVVEDQVKRVVNLSWAIVTDTGVFTLHLAIGGIALMIPYLFVWGIFLAFMLEGLFKLLAVTVLAPLAIVAAGFEPTRGFTISAARIVIGGALTVICASIAMGFTVAVLRYYTAPPIIPIDADGNIAVRAAEFVFGDKYLAILLLGFISILFHLKAASLAASISGAIDGPGAASAVVGSGMSLLNAAKSAGLAPLARYGRKAWDKADSAVAPAPRNLLQRFTRRPSNQ
jgi:hypothetical protein